MRAFHVFTALSLTSLLALAGCGGGGGGGGSGGTGAQGGGGTGGTGAQGGTGGTGAQGGSGAQGGTGGSGAQGGGGSGGSGSFQWYTTCGAPVCSGNTDDPAIPECTGQTEGSPCSPAGDLCELTNDGCDANLICADHDPKDDPGGCPKSVASSKHDISYLGDAERERIRDEVMTMPLATWKYNRETGGEKEHLGFIIDDQPPSSPAVRPSGERVDLYGYTSMAVAAIQAQDKEISALRREVEALRDDLRRSQAAASACSEQAPSSSR